MENRMYSRMYLCIVIDLMTYRTANESLPLFASKLDELEHIDHALNLESLQLSMQGDKHSSATNPIAACV